MSKKESLWQILSSHSPDIILVSETWLKPDINDPEVIPPDLNYELFRNDRKDGYGGVLVAVKRDLIYELVIKDDTCEFLAVKVSCKHNSVIVAALYRPTNNDSEYAIRLASAIESLVRKHPKDVIWIGGDANLPDIEWTTNSIYGNSYRKDINETVLQAMENCGLDQVVDFPTRDDNLLDIFFTNRPSLIQSCTHLPGVSDHEIVFVDSDVSAKYQRPVKRKIWLWDKADLNLLKEDMRQFSDTFTVKHSIKSDVDMLWTAFSEKCTEMMTELVPSKMTSSRFSQPWINRGIKRLSRRKKRAYRRARISKDKTDWLVYKQLKRQTQRECRNAYSSHVNNLVSEDQASNPKKLYSFVKSKKCDASGVAPLSSDGVNHSDSLKKANILNTQFTSVFTNEDTSNVPKLNSTDHPSVKSIVVNRKGVLKLLNDINPYKATGPDAIPGRLLKSLSEEVADILCLIFQASLDQGKIPKAWKKAYISPIFKKGDRHKPSNYRPVSLTSICCKILEHIVHSHVISHLDRHQMLSDAQHGFRKSRSCETQLILTIQDLANGLNNGEQIDAILLDFSKAFDKVPHQRLLEKLRHYGVRG
ncbi:MAG: reverse transcriptase domain-containing protein, partial [Candidatus Thiodiazotropha sp.]